MTGADKSLDNWNTLIQLTREIKKTILTLKSQESDQDKRRRLEWAIDHSTTNEFTFYDKDENGRVEQCTSGWLIKNILIDFRKGYTYEIPYDCAMENVYKSYGFIDEDKVEESEQEFRDALQEQLFDLIGLKPRIRWDDDDEAYYLHYR